MRSADDRPRLPVSVLSGFLGAGKTTLLNAEDIDWAAFARLSHPLPDWRRQAA